MNEKNEQDIFKNLIDSIHVDEDAAPEKEPVQVPVRQSGAPGISDRPVQENGAEPAAVPIHRTNSEDEALPKWLTEKRPPAREEHPASSESRRASVSKPASGQVQAGRSVSSREERGARPSEKARPNSSAQEKGQPSAAPAEDMQRKTAPSGGKTKKKVKKQYRVGRALLLTLLFLALSVYLAFFAIHAFEDLTAVTLFGDDGAAEQQMTVEIPKGSSTGEIAQILKKNGVITEPLAFRLYVMLKQKDGFQSGEYIMTDKMDYDSIIYALQAGTERTDVVEIMFPEGSTSVDIAQKLEEKGVCSAKEFLAALNSSDYNYTFVDNIPQNALRFYKLEGYLFPNTHQFFVGESVSSVVNRFLKDFSSKITDEMRTRMNELNLTLDQTLALASIIQKEASDPDEMKNISEVFHNRLRNSDAYPNLQSDPTIYYVERVIKKNIGMTNQAMYDAYNTYVCNGLPVGPICNPGLDAIEAALYPAQHEQTYYYFVTDNAGTYYYAETLDQHNANIAQADKVNAELAKNASAAS